MSNKPKVLIYGASGYTGKLISEYLAKRDIPFIAAGRNADRLKQQLANVPFIERVEVTYAAVEHNLEALITLFEGVKVVINVVGPFAQLGHEVVQACLAVGAHYQDTTGEQDWVLDVQEKYGQAFAEKNLVLAPSTSWMWNAGLMAAEVALETPGIDSLDILYAPNGNPSPASTKSFLRMCCQPQMKLENNELVAWPEAQAYETSVPGFHQHLLALPWSGGVEPVWYKSDKRVRNCSVLTAFTNRPMMEMIVDRLKSFSELAPSLSEQEQEDLTNAWGEEICNTEPPREVETINRVVISCWARGSTVAKQVVFFNTCGYLQTGVMAAEFAERLLRNQNKTVGFTSATHCIGHRELIAACAEEGMHMVEKLGI